MANDGIITKLPTKIEGNLVVHLHWMSQNQITTAQEVVSKHHYLHTPVDTRTSPQGYFVSLDQIEERVGLLLFGRPEATLFLGWYGGLKDIESGRCEVTRWQVLNLSRVWFSPDVQVGGKYYHPDFLPGFYDRKGYFHSTLASTVITMALGRVGCDYLLARPPIFLNEPYQIEWCLSYCDTKVHKGTLYSASGFELFSTNKRKIQTWRKRLKPLKTEQIEFIRVASRLSERAQKYRAEKIRTATQLSLDWLEEHF